MSVLRNLESKLAGLVEGTFSRAFKSEVRPVEIARKLTREMEEHKVQSLSRTYAPNEYAVWLSPDDRKQFEGYEGELATELSGYLLEHARRERIALRHLARRSRSGPTTGCGWASSASRRGWCAPPRTSRRRRARATRATRWSTRRPSGSPSRCASPITAAARARLRYEGRTAVLGSGGGVIGRSRDCDVVLADAERLAPPRRGAAQRRLVDRQGPRLDQRREGQRPPDQGPQSLKPGDAIELGTSPRRLRAGVAAMALDPVAVALKFGFLAMLYLFLLWMARSALKDLRRGARRGAPAALRRRRDRHARRLAGLGGDGHGGAPKLRVRDRGGPARGLRLRSLATAPCSGGASRRTSGWRTRSRPSQHARLVPHGEVIVLEDLGSTNGTYLNEEPLRGPQPLHAGDRIRIGDSEFTFER